MITLHHLNNSRSHRILWLLEELELEYEIKSYERDLKTMLAPASLKAIHPLGKSPVLTDGDATIAESGVIIDYLIEKYGKGKFKPMAETPEALQYTYWLQYAEASLMPPLLVNLILSKIETAPMPFFVKPIARGIAKNVRRAFLSQQLKTHFDFVESQLSEREWFAGPEFTGADIQMSFPLEAALARGVLGERPHCQKFVHKIHLRPAYVRACQRGGKLKL